MFVIFYHYDLNDLIVKLFIFFLKNKKNININIFKYIYIYIYIGCKNCKKIVINEANNYTQISVSA